LKISILSLICFIFSHNSVHFPKNITETTTFEQDIASGLSQVLSDGTNTYLYGYNRISQTNTDATGYFLDDAIGSVRQVAGIAVSSDVEDTDSELTILLAKSYSPYGETIDSVGTFETSFGFTSEMTDDTGLINLRARWYAPGQGRFITKDSWSGDYYNPITLVKWVYTNADPITETDPSGMMPTEPCGPGGCKDGLIRKIYKYSNNKITSQIICDLFEILSLPDEYPVEIMHTSEEGIDFIEDEETLPNRGWERWPYGDLGDRQGTCTIGYGTVIDEKILPLENCDYEMVTGKKITTITSKGTQITKPLINNGRYNGLSESNADDLVRIHIRSIPEVNIKNFLWGMYLSQNEYDALVSYIYNGADLTDTLKNNLYTNQLDEVGYEMLKRTSLAISKKTSPVLIQRRKQEVELFINGDYDYRN